MRRGEEVRQLPSAEGMAEHPEGARRIAEATRRLSRGEPLHEVSPQGFVLALAWGCRLRKELLRVC